MGVVVLALDSGPPDMGLRAASCNSNRHRSAEELARRLGSPTSEPALLLPGSGPVFGSERSHSYEVRIGIIKSN